MKKGRKHIRNNELTKTRSSSNNNRTAGTVGGGGIVVSSECEEFEEMWKRIEDKEDRYN